MEGPGFRRELTRRGLLDRLGRSSNARRSEDPFGDGKEDVQLDFVLGRTEITLVVIRGIERSEVGDSHF